MPWTSRKTVSARLSVRLHEDKFNPAKTLRLEDGADVGFENFDSKYAGVMVVVEESVSESVTHCVIITLGGNNRKIRVVLSQ
jgi:hypothetical protein